VELYIQVSFWIMLTGFVLTCISAGILKYPRSLERTLGFEVSTALIRIPFLVWMGILLWGGG